MKSRVVNVTSCNYALMSAASFTKLPKQSENYLQLVIGAISLKDIKQGFEKSDIVQREEVIACLPTQI